MRFVVLRHAESTGVHFDLMIERTDGRLDAWRTPRFPFDGRPFAAIRLAHHRAAYLTFEGSVPINRGRVDRVEAGRAEPLIVGDDRLAYRLAGDVDQDFAGVVTLDRIEPSEDVDDDSAEDDQTCRWRVEFQPRRRTGPA